MVIDSRCCRILIRDLKLLLVTQASEGARTGAEQATGDLCRQAGEVPRVPESHRAFSPDNILPLSGGREAGMARGWPPSATGSWGVAGLALAVNTASPTREPSPPHSPCVLSTGSCQLAVN